MNIKSGCIGLLLWIFPAILLAQSLSVDFKFSPDSVCSGVDVSFISTVTGGNKPYTYDWNFGDGTPSSKLANPTHKFDAYGCDYQQFTVTLNVYDKTTGTPLTGKIFKIVTVKRRPDPKVADNAGMFFSNCDNIPPPSPANPTFSISIKDNTANTACIDPASYTIDWGDGTLPLLTPAIGFSNIAHTYARLGGFPLVFSAKGTNGCSTSNTTVIKNEAYPNGAIDISGTYSITCAPVEYKFLITGNAENSPGTMYDIDFGDNEIAHLTHTEVMANNGIVTHTYNTASCPGPNHVYNVVMTIDNSCGKATSQRTTSIVWAKPFAKVGAGSNMCVNTCITFSNLSSVGYGPGCIVNDKYHWDFENGKTYDVQYPPCQTYQTAGDYEMKLTTSNYCGDSIITFPFTIEPLPVAMAIPDQPQGCIPFGVHFTDQSTGGKLTYNWSVNSASGYAFTDSTTALSAEPSIKFTEAGSYNVNLTVNNDCNQSTKSFTIKALDKQKVDLASLPTLCQGTAIQTGLSGFVTYASNATPITDYQWTGTSGVTFSSDKIDFPTITFNETGTANVTVNVSNACGTITLAKPVVIDKPVQLLAGNDTVLCSSGNALQLIAAQPVADAYWKCADAGPCPVSGSSFSLATAGTYSIQYFKDGCIIPGDRKITVSQSPIVTITGNPDVSVCKNDTTRILLNASPANGTWSGQGVSGSYFVPSGLAIGNYALSYSVRDAANGCQGTGIKTVNILYTPDAAFSASGPYCVGKPILFSPTDGTSHQWNYNDPGIDWVNTDNHTFYTPGNYSIGHKAISGICSDTASIALQVKPGAPIPQYALASNSGCQPFVLSFSYVLDSTGYSGDFSSKWYIDGALKSSWYKPPAIIFADAGAHTVKWELSNDCDTKEMLTNVTVKPLPLADFTIKAPITCSPATVTFVNNSIGDSYTWSVDGISVAIDPGNPSYTIITNTTHNYIVHLVSDNSCGTSTTTKQLTIYPAPPAPQYSLVSSIECQPFTLAFAGITDSTVLVGDFTSKWYADGIQTSAWFKPPATTFNNAGSHTLKWELSNRCGTQEKLSNINVKPLPLADFAIDYSSACSPAIVNFVNHSIGEIYTWSVDGKIVAIDPLNPSYTFTAGTTSTYTVGLVSDNSCGTSDITKQFVVYPVPPKPQYSLVSNSECQPFTLSFATMTDSTTLYGDFISKWYADGIQQSATYKPPVVTFKDAGNHTIKWELSNRCGAQELLSNLTVKPDPLANFGLDFENNCSPATVKFINRSIGNTFNWYVDGTNVPLDTLLPAYTFATNTPRTFTIRLVATNSCGSNGISKDFSVFPNTIQGGFNRSPLKICVGDTVFFNDISYDSSFMNTLITRWWDFDDGGGAIYSNNFSISHIYNISGVFHVKLSVNDGCSKATVIHNVEVLPGPTASFSINRATSQLNNLPAQLSVTNTSTDGFAFEWYIDKAPLPSYISKSPSIVLTMPGQHTIQLKVINAEGCTDDTLINYDLYFYKLYLPDALLFSSQNPEDRIFTPKGTGLTKFHIKIYNKWDNLLWESERLEDHSPAESWDGTYKGVKVPEGVYYWIITGLEFENGSNTPDNEFENTGVIHVIY